MIKRIRPVKSLSRFKRSKKSRRSNPPRSPRGKNGGEGKSTERCVSVDADSYPVGYGKPPKSGQFHKGVSGNRQGRPKGARGVANLLVEALNEHVIVVENGSPKRMSKLEAALRQLADRGAAGDLRALNMVLKRVDIAEARSEPAEELEAADDEVAQGIIKRIRDAQE